MSGTSSEDNNSTIEFSDDQQDITWDKAKRFKIVFGKHKGKRLGALVKKAKHREYLRYLLTWSEIRPDTQANITCALEHYADAKKCR
jgi:hypothetical protein